jgi:hypothetical protein
MVVRSEDIKERSISTTSIEEMLINGIKTSAHAEIERDQQVVATGVIANLSETVAGDFDTHIEKVREYIGVPDHDFTHMGVNTEKNAPNNVYLIMTGLSPVNNRIDQTQERINEIEEQQKQRIAESSIVNSMDVSSMAKRASARDGSSRKDVDASSLNLESIFKQFGVE